VRSLRRPRRLAHAPRGGGGQSAVPAADRIAVLAQYFRLVAPLNDAARRRAAAELASHLTADQRRRLGERFDSERLLNWEELRQLAAMPDISIQAHALNHGFLHAGQDPAMMESEIRQCRIALEEKLQRPVRRFAYPGGVHCPRAERILQEAGYDAAFTIEPGDLDGSSPRFRLPRVPGSPHPAVQRRLLACAADGGGRGMWW